MIYKLGMLGWSQEKIGLEVGLSRTGVETVLTESAKLQKTLKTAFTKEKPIEEIAEYHGLDLQTTYALILQGNSDEERFETIGEIMRVIVLGS